MIRAVFFDAGDTLLRPYPSFAELFSRVLAERDVVVEPADVQATWAVAWRRFHEAAGEQELWSTSPERSRRFWLSVYEVFFEELGLPGGDGLGEALYATFSDMANYRLFPDVAPAIDVIGRSGRVMGVVSNFEAWLDTLLDLLGLREALPFRAISGIEGVEKPNPALFSAALHRAGVPPDEALYVGDSVEFDMVPARALGMTSVLLDRRDRYASFDGIRITSMSQLPAVVGA